jgi:hypothetical protein
VPQRYDDAGFAFSAGKKHRTCTAQRYPWKCCRGITLWMIDCEIDNLILLALIYNVILHSRRVTFHFKYLFLYIYRDVYKDISVQQQQRNGKHKQHVFVSLRSQLRYCRRNQDALESCFSKIRTKGGLTTRPL